MTTIIKPKVSVWMLKNGIFIHYWGGGMLTGASTMEKSTDILKTELLYDPAILLLVLYLKEMKRSPRGFCISMIIAALFTIPKIRKQLKYPLIDV